MDARYAQLLVNFFISFMYITGMPLMAVLGFFSFFVAFWVDKYLFCNFYRTPPMYSATMGRLASWIIGWSIIAHLLMSMWIMGNGTIFLDETQLGLTQDKSEELMNEESSFYEMLFVNKVFTQPHIRPLFLLLVLFIACTLLNLYTYHFKKIAKTIFKVITCNSICTEYLTTQT